VTGRGRAAASAGSRRTRWRLGLAVVVLAVLAGTVVVVTRPPRPSVPTCPTAAPCTIRGPTGQAVELVPYSAAAENAFYYPPNPLPPAPPGTLIRVQPLAPDVSLPPQSIAWRMLYHSESADGTDIAVSGIVIAPDRRPPRSGFPLVDYAHATTGLAEGCAPSRFADLGIPSLDEMVASGDAVVATDYQGLGTPGPHPYLVGDSEAHAVLDAARAARQVPGVRVANRVVIDGYSQGGHAALFADQIAPDYAPHVGLRGVVAQAPAVDLPELVAHTYSSRAFTVLLATLVVSWSEVYPDLPLTSLVRPDSLHAALLANDLCGVPLVVALQSFTPATLAAPGLRQNEAFLDQLLANSPGSAPLSVPTLVVTGDNDVIVPSSLVTAYVHAACTQPGTDITYGLYRHAGHGTITTVAAPEVQAFTAARFDGLPTPAGCPHPLGAPGTMTP
jgi:pimeloyl-ACP methyl ester carboxylesterase